MRESYFMKQSFALVVFQICLCHMPFTKITNPELPFGTAFSNSPTHSLRQPQSSNASRAVSPPHHRHKKNMVPAENSDIIATPNVPSAPAPGMYWSRATTYGRLPSKCLRAHTATVVGELMYIFGGCDVRNCFTTLYILDLGKLMHYKYLRP
jgi:hypothetical protein